MDIMADVRPLRGVRFDSRLSGPVGSLIAPPYDVAAEPANGAEFSIRKIESVDLGGGGDDHAWAAERYRRWLKQGVLRRDAAPMVYVHRHQFNQNGVMNLRTGLMARVRLADWTERVFGFGARTIAIIDTATTSPFAQLSMIPLLTMCAIYAPKGHRATWFALMASLMNLALVAGSLQTKYLNEIFVVSRGSYENLPYIVGASLLIGFIVPMAAIFAFGRRLQ